MRNHLFILAIAMVLVVSVHVNHDELQDYSEPEYLSSLSDMDRRVRADWQKVSKLIDHTKQQLAQAQISNAEKISVLEETLAEERDVLGRIESYIGLPFSLKPCTKAFNLTDHDRKDINSQLDHIRESIIRLKSDIDMCGDCLRLAQMRKQIALEEQYISSIESLMTAECRRGREFREDIATGLIDLNFSVPISNLEAPNWAYGNITANEYKYMMFALASKYNVTKCKPAKPFALNHSVCIQCPKQTPMWNIGREQCIACPPGHYFHTRRLNCTKGINLELPNRIYNSHPKALNFIGKRPLPDQKLQTCPIQQPFSNGEECIVCRPPLIFNFNNKTCMQCPEKTVYSMNLRRCTKQSRDMYSSLDEAQNWITDQKKPLEFINQWKKQSERDKSKICPNSTPYFDGISCIVCVLPKVFHMETLLCVSTVEPWAFDENIHRIVQRSTTPYNTRPDAPYLLIEPGTQPPTNTTNLCPLSEPYFDSIVCIQCRQPRPIFNYKSKRCTMCSPGKLFDPTLKRCEVITTRYFTNLGAQNILILGNKTLQDYKTQQTTQRIHTPFETEVCPQFTPFIIKGSCQNCPNIRPLYNIDTMTCESCLKNQIFMNQLHRCLPIKRVTNRQASFLLTSQPSSYDNLVEEIDKSKTDKLHRLIECPTERPYFNGRDCIICNEPTPLFSLDTRTCTKCSVGTIYSEQTLSCRKIIFATSPNAPNLVVADIAKYRQQFDHLRKENENFAQCPPISPYYANEVCISCPSERRLFDLDKKECVRCKADYNYHPDRRRCLKQKVLVSSSLQKMLMNIG